MNGNGLSIIKYNEFIPFHANASFSSPIQCFTHCRVVFVTGHTGPHSTSMHLDACKHGYFVCPVADPATLKGFKP